MWLPKGYGDGQGWYPSTSGTLGPYLGPVATRTTMSNGSSASFFQATARNRHQAMVPITAISLGIANYYVYIGTLSETGVGAPATCYAAIQQASGSTVTRLTWSGAQFGTIADGAIGYTDLTPVNIAAGEYFWTKIFYQNPAGIWYNIGPQDPTTANAEGVGIVVSGATDTTMTFGNAGLVVNTNSCFGPCALLGMTTQPTVVLLGDSRVQSGADTFDGTSVNIGETARSIGANLAYINIAVAADALCQFTTTTNTNRLQLAGFCSSAQCNYGINDFDLYSQTSAQLISNVAVLKGLLGSSKQLGYDTVSPHSNPGNTAPNSSTTETNRIAFNTALRSSSVPGVSFYSETANVVESPGQNGGLWNGAYFVDGLHGNQAGMLAIEASGAINTSLFHR